MLRRRIVRRYILLGGYLANLGCAQTNYFRSREEAVAITPRIRDNWTSSGQPSPCNGRGRELPRSPAGRVPPFMPSPLSAEFPRSPYPGPSSHGVPPSLPGWANYDSSQPLRHDRMLPTVPGSQRGRILPTGEVFSPSYGANFNDSYHHGSSDHSLWPGNIGNLSLSLSDTPAEPLRSPPGFESEPSAPFEWESHGPAQAPIGTNRPCLGSRSGGVNHNGLQTRHRNRTSSPGTTRRRTPGSRSSHRDPSRPANADDNLWK